MKDPLVSVIVPVYNYQNYITWCIKSILVQNYSNLELIVVDDCSTDKSYRVASRLAERDSRIKAIRLPANGGYSKAKNEGIVLSQGEFIVTLDADDMLTKESIVPRLKALEDSGSDFVHARAISVGAHHSLDDCYALKRRKRANPKIHAQSVMMRREVHKTYGLYDEGLRSRSDKEMWWRLFGQGLKGVPKVKRIYIPDDVAYYRIHTRSMMVQRRRDRRYNEEVTNLLYKAYKERQKNGITPANTRFLET